MLGFLFPKKRDNVQRVLYGRVNRAHARSVIADNFREGSRGAVTEVVWVLPCNSFAEADYSQVFPAVARDLSMQGISIIHSGQITAPRAIVALLDGGCRFLLCSPRHSTVLGYGFYQIGFIADEVIDLAPEDVETMSRAMAAYGSAESPVAVGCP